MTNKKLKKFKIVYKEADNYKEFIDHMQRSLYYIRATIETPILE